jgi:hypothetical protein
MAQPAYPRVREGLMWALASDPDDDGDDDSTPERDTDHDWWSTDGRPMRSQAASGLPQIQQHTDPSNNPDPEGDELPVGVAFPVGDNSPQSTFSQQWSTGPDGPQPRTGAFQVTAVAWSRKHYEDLAATISTLPEHLRGPVAESFGRQMPGTGSNGLGPFDRDKFIGAATDPGSYSWRSRDRHPGYTQGHHDAVADMLRGTRYSGAISDEDFHNHVVPTIAGAMHAGSAFNYNGNRTFNPDRFARRVQLEGPLATSEFARPDRPSRPAPRQAPAPRPSRPAAPSFARGIDPGTESGLSGEGTHYDPYGEGFTNPSRGGRPPESETEYDPIFGWRNKAMLRRTAYAQVSSTGADMLGRADAMNNQQPEHKDSFGASKQKHRRYLEGWNQTAGLIHGLVGRAPLTKQEYGEKTGRPDLHSHYLAAYSQGRALHGQSNSLYRADDGGQTTASLRRQADTWTQPRQSTDDVNPPYNSPVTSPEPWSSNASPQSADFQAGLSAGQADRSAGERPLFADNSSTVSPYVKGYAQGYGAAQGPSGPQDVPRSMGGDSGQAVNAQEAQGAFQVARASRRTASAQDAWEDARDNLERQHDVTGGRNVSGAPGDEKLEGEGTGGRSGATWKTSSLRRVSAAFAPDSLMDDPDFRKGYLFARKWHPGQRLAGKGSARFEAGLYAGITDHPGVQQRWFTEHMARSGTHPELSRRMMLHQDFTRRHEAARGRAPRGTYLQAEGGVSTDLITDGPGTSPDPMGSTPLNGPGSPPPMGGLSQAAVPGGAPPYQGAPPLPGGPVVPDDVMGQPQRQPQPDGPMVQTFSGVHPENVTLAPTAPNSADRGGYTNRDAYRGDPHGNDRLAAFRRTVRASLAKVSMMSREGLVDHLEHDHMLPAQGHPDPRGWHQVLHEDYDFAHDHDPAELAHNPWNVEDWE